MWANLHCLRIKAILNEPEKENWAFSGMVVLGINVGTIITLLTAVSVQLSGSLVCLSSLNACNGEISQKQNLRVGTYLEYKINLRLQLMFQP